VTPLLKTLLAERHLHEYSSFTVEYRRVARELELPRTAEPPTKAAYYHWLSGKIRDLPRGYHCLVLEQMFPGWTAKDLFSSVDIRRSRSGASRQGLLGPIAPALDPEKFAGLWCTAYVYEGAHHVDVTSVTVTNGGMTARNTSPPPRTEGRALGFHNDINFDVVGRHLIGQWLNTSDSYYFGSLHLAALPGETVLDGMYSAIVSDSQVVAGRWRWVRIEPRTALGIDLTTVSLADPNRLHTTIFEHDPYSRPIPLAEIIEDPR
jgi:hypothetical protein